MFARDKIMHFNQVPATPANQQNISNAIRERRAHEICMLGYVCIMYSIVGRYIHKKYMYKIDSY